MSRVAELAMLLGVADELGVLERAQALVESLQGVSRGGSRESGGTYAGNDEARSHPSPHFGEAGEPTGERRGLCLPGGSALEGE